MSYPTPTVYTYRVLEVPAIPSVSAGQFFTQFSTNSGSTWLYLSGLPFQSLTEAQLQIAFVVGSEAVFHAAYLKNSGIVAGAAVAHSYPPS